MRRNPDTGVIELTRRNLVSLLAKLDQEGSACTLLKDGVAVMAVEDHEHYSERQPGEVHSLTAFIVNANPELRDLAGGEFVP